MPIILNVGEECEDVICECEDTTAHTCNYYTNKEPDRCPVEKIQLVPNREQIALDLLPQQFKGKHNVEGLIKLFSDEIQLIEFTLIDLLTLRTLDKATGVQLDNIGERLGVRRTQQDDEIYRSSIRVKILSKVNEGTEEDILPLLKLLSRDDSASVYKFHPYGATVSYNIENTPEDRIDRVVSIFPVVTDFYIEEFNTTKGFGFSSISNPDPDASTVNYGAFSTTELQVNASVEGSFASLAFPSI